MSVREFDAEAWPGAHHGTAAAVRNRRGEHPEWRCGAAVLRFTAGARTIDLSSWPRDWADLPDQRLVKLLRNAIDRPIMTFTPESPRRRYNDPPADGRRRSVSGAR